MTLIRADNPSENTKRPIFVCRALHSGIWVAGSQQEGDKRCRVTLTGSVKSYEHYQLLENVDSAARLAWANWTKLGQPPTGAVASAEKLYIARHAQSPAKPGQSHYIGSLNFQDSAGTITYVKEVSVYTLPLLQRITMRVYLSIIRAAK